MKQVRGRHPDNTVANTSNNMTCVPKRVSPMPRNGRVFHHRRSILYDIFDCQSSQRSNDSILEEEAASLEDAFSMQQKINENN